MIVGFHTNQIGERGTEVALYDYAIGNIAILGNQSVIFAPSEKVRNVDVLKKFQEKFSVVLYESREDFYEKTKSYGIDVCYYIKSGENDGLVSPYCRNAVHAVFNCNDPHGDRYAYISRWLSKKASKNDQNYVPHIISIKKSSDSLRQNYDPNNTKKIFGCYGGEDSFNIWYATLLVILIANLKSNFIFIFMNTRLRPKSRFLKSLLQRGLKRKNIVYLEAQVSDEEKSKFINTCDAMLHARRRGESFGIAIGEFSVHQKPILTCNNFLVRDRCHLDILGADGNYYHGPLSLLFQLFKSVDEYGVSDVYQKEYNSAVVMKRFENIFLDFRSDT